MCIGIPLQVVEVLGDGAAAIARSRAGAAETVDLSLVGPLEPGAWVLTFMGAARSVLTAEEAAMVADALEALSVAAEGGGVDHLFAALVDREPQLPPHLRPDAAD